MPQTLPFMPIVLIRLVGIERLFCFDFTLKNRPYNPVDSFWALMKEFVALSSPKNDKRKFSLQNHMTWGFGAQM